MIPRVALAQDGGRVRVTWADGEACDLPARWLFDHCDEARDPASGQRGQGALALQDACALGAAQIDGETLKLRFSPSGAERSIGVERLRNAAPAPDVSLWPTPEPIADAEPVVFEDYLRSDLALREALARVARWGIAVLAGAGADPDAVARAVERFGFIRETNYGRLFDVRIELQPGNLAYTDRALELHTDNPYRDPVPTLQLLHAITADAGGGETLFVDGFAQAEALRRADPAAFEVLARTPVRFTFRAASGERWSATAPVLELGPAGGLRTVRLNHRSLDISPGDAAALEAWYEAYLAFYRLAHASGVAFERRLAPGEMVIFDNRRLLHGRRALSGASSRWLRGCYADADGLAATLARLDRDGG